MLGIRQFGHHFITRIGCRRRTGRRRTGRRRRVGRRRGIGRHRRIHRRYRIGHTLTLRMINTRPSMSKRRTYLVGSII